MITRSVLIVGIFLCLIYNLKLNRATSQNDHTNDTDTEEPKDKEKTGGSEMFIPTHEWQRIKEGKLET